MGNHPAIDQARDEGNRSAGENREQHGRKRPQAHLQGKIIGQVGGHHRGEPHDEAE